MTKLISLTQNKDFRRIYHRGKSFATPAIVVYYTKNRLSFCRLGITVGKKIGGAVERNRVKRIIRVAYSTVIDDLLIENNCYDFVIVARNRAVNLKSTEIEKQLINGLTKAGLIKK